MKAYFYDIDKCRLTVGDMEDFQSEEVTEMYLNSSGYKYSQTKDYLEYVGLRLSDIKCYFSNNILIKLSQFLNKEKPCEIVKEYFTSNYKDNGHLSLSVKEDEVRIKLHYENTVTDEETVMYYDINDFYDVFVMYYIRSMFYGIGGTYEKTGNNILIHPDDKFPEPISDDHKVEMWSTINSSSIEDLYSYYTEAFSRLEDLGIKREKITKDDFELSVKFYKQIRVVELWGNFNIPIHIGITLHLVCPWKEKNMPGTIMYDHHVKTIIHFKEWGRKLGLT